MEYIFLTVAIFAFSIQFIFSKQYELSTKGGIRAGLWFSFIKGFLSVFLFLVLSRFNIYISVSAIVWAVIYSICSVLCSSSSILATSKGSVGKVSMYTLSGGLLIPFVVGLIVWNEEVSFTKIVGSIIILAAIIIQNFSLKKDKENMTFNLLCLVVFATNGLISIASKAAEVSSTRVPTNSFLFICSLFTYVIAAAILIGINNRNIPQFKFKFKYLIPIALYTGMNSAGNYFSLSAARTLDASIQFPILSSAIVIITVVLAFVFFKEKPKARDLFALGLNTLGIICFLFV